MNVRTVKGPTLQILERENSVVIRGRNRVVISERGVQGPKGTAGEEVLLQKSATHIQWKYESASEWNDLVPLSELKGADGSDGADGEDGTDGREVSLRVDSGYIQWQYSGDGSWTNLIALSSLKGEKGDTGIGLIAGGTTGQILKKKSNADHDTEWKDEQDISGKLNLAQTPGSEQEITGSTPKLAVLKSKTILGTDANGKIVEGVHQDISGKEDAGVAAGLAGQHLSDFAHGDIAHTNRSALDAVSGVNTGDQTAIKKTFYSEKVWHTGDSVFLKLTYAMLGNSSFWRVYEDDILLTYETDWEFNDEKGFKIGSVADLVDGIKLLSPTNGSVYRFEYDEYQLPYSPMLGLYRSDGKMSMKGMPPNRITGEGSTGVLTAIARAGNETDDIDYEMTFNGGETFTKPLYYANRLCVSQFQKGQAFPTNWRMEVYKQGRHWSERRKKTTGTYNTTMNSVLSPRIVYTTNEANIMWMIDKKRTGVFYVRMRNTTTNEVSQFSFQSVCTRKFYYSNADYSAGKGGFFKISLK